jgi:hypothetical protein
MARLIYSTFSSIDGYTEDEHGTFGWGAPDYAHRPRPTVVHPRSGLAVAGAKRTVYPRTLAEPRSARNWIAGGSKRLTLERQRAIVLRQAVTR